MTFHEAPNIFATQVHLNVSNLERSIKFYQEYIGLRVLRIDEHVAVFTANGVDPILSIEHAALKSPQQFRSAGLYHFALLLPTRKDLAAALAHLLRKGYPLQGGADHAVSEAVYLADPDGNGIELCHDRPSNQWKWRGGKVFMPTEALDEHIMDELDGDTEWTGLPEQTILGHMHLQVADLKASEAFYCQVLGFDLVASYGSQADFLSTGGYHHHIGLNIWRSKGITKPDDDAVGIKNFTLQFPGEERRNTVAERSQQLGASVRTDGEAMLITDPSNITIRLVI